MYTVKMWYIIRSIISLIRQGLRLPIIDLISTEINLWTFNDAQERSNEEW